jgi:hypothetical protein
MATPRPPSDPDVKIPASVARSAALADELLKQQQAAQEGLPRKVTNPRKRHLKNRLPRNSFRN